MQSWVRIGDVIKTKSEIDDRAQRAARGYAELGVGSGDVVAVYLRNDFAFMEASLAAGLCGAYVVPAPSW
jgi:long-chain acyl-CoA synthetase